MIDRNLPKVLNQLKDSYKDNDKLTFEIENIECIKLDVKLGEGMAETSRDDCELICLVNFITKLIQGESNSNEQQEKEEKDTEMNDGKGN